VLLKEAVLQVLAVLAEECRPVELPEEELLVFALV
jgi:hypothetical protein